MPDSLVVKLSTNPVATWLIRNVASRLDPLIFRITNGRLTSFGPPAMPMLTLTAIGRRSGTALSAPPFPESCPDSPSPPRGEG